MKKKHYLDNIWVLFGAYGVWFTIFSGLEEIQSGKYWKSALAFGLAVATNIAIVRKLVK